MSERHTRGRQTTHSLAATGSTQNGRPETAYYTWHGGDAKREAEVATRLAAIRAKLAAPPEPEPPVRAEKPRCLRCGYVVAKCDCRRGPKLPEVAP